jgi:hypothetical protein
VVPEDIKEDQNVEVNKVAEMFETALLAVEAKSCEDKKMLFLIFKLKMYSTC